MFQSRRGGVMAATGDLKSPVRKDVRVRSPPSAPRMCSEYCANAETITHKVCLISYLLLAAGTFRLVVFAINSIAEIPDIGEFPARSCLARKISFTFQFFNALNFDAFNA